MTNNAVLEALFLEHFGIRPEAVEALPAAGSDRRYYRLHTSAHRAVGTVSAAVEENKSFFYFTQLLRSHNVPAPQVYSISADNTSYLQQDLGHTSLFDRLQAEGHTPLVYALFERAVEGLARVHWAAGPAADYTQCHGARAFDAARIYADLQYFREKFLDRQAVSYDQPLVEAEMRVWADLLAAAGPQTLMYRDFQSRNVMVDDKSGVWFIDYQGAMQGPPQYDLASLLWQAKAALPEAWKSSLLSHYLHTVREQNLAKLDEASFLSTYTELVLLRLMQVLGAYGFRGLEEGRPHFLSSIAPALRSLRAFLSRHPAVPDFPALREVLEEVSAEAVEARYTNISTTKT